MTTFSRSPVEQGGGSMLLAEFLHRSRNEYARAISLASLIAARSCSQETKAALREVTDHLHRTAETQRVLCPPISGGIEDFTENLSQLCRAMTASLQMEGRGITLLLTGEGPMWLDVGRSWRAGLVIFELASNACRHAFDGRSGRVSIGVTTASGEIVCRVSDDGASPSSFRRGLGTQLVDALVTELDGFVERQFGECGAVVTVSFPIESQGERCPSLGVKDQEPARRRHVA